MSKFPGFPCISCGFKHPTNLGTLCSFPFLSLLFTSFSRTFQGASCEPHKNDDALSRTRRLFLLPSLSPPLPLRLGSLFTARECVIFPLRRFATEDCVVGLGDTCCNATLLSRRIEYTTHFSMCMSNGSGTGRHTARLILWILWRGQTLRSSTPQTSRPAPRKEPRNTGGCERK